MSLSEDLRDRPFCAVSFPFLLSVKAQNVCVCLCVHECAGGEKGRPRERRRKLIRVISESSLGAGSPGAASLCWRKARVQGDLGGGITSSGRMNRGAPAQFQFK